MLTVSANKFKRLLKSLNKRISIESSKFCIAEECGYCSNKSELSKLIFIKELLIKNFIRKKVSKDYNCIEIKGDTVIRKTFNKVIGNKIELLVVKTTKKIKSDKTFTWEFPLLPQPNGVWVDSLFIPIPVNSVSDFEKIKNYLENKKLFSFFAFSIDYGKKMITSCTYETEEIESCNEYKDLDSYCGICLDENKLKKLIEDVC